MFSDFEELVVAKCAKIINIIIYYFFIFLSHGFGFKITDPISDKPQNQYYSFRNNQGKEK